MSNRAKMFFSGLVLFTLSMSSLGLEIIFLRYFSFLFEHSYVYILISLVMAGLGFGSVVLYFMNENTRQRYFKQIRFLPLVLFVLLLLTNVLYASIGFSLVILLLFFMFIGSCTTYLFQKSGVRLSVLYFFDLSGASLGAVISIFMMDNLGPVQSAIILILILCASSWVLYRYYFQDSKRGLPVWISVTVAAIFLFSVNTNALLIPAHNADKDMIHSLHDTENNARIIDTRWTSFGRSDLVEKDNQSYKTLYIDGAAGTRMLRMENGMLDKKQYFDLSYNFVAGVALNTLHKDQRKDALVIGSGGGSRARFKKCPPVKQRPHSGYLD